jgi:hypothetical protein
MFTVIGYITRFEQQEGDRFSASVDVERYRESVLR